MNEWSSALATTDQHRPFADTELSGFAAPWRTSLLNYSFLSIKEVNGLLEKC